jgi:enoyl-CoA hydratase/carnithine racemase
MAAAPAPCIEVTIEPRERGSVATLTIHNETKLNTLTRPLMMSLITGVETLAARRDLRALVVTGAGGKAFIGGANIDEMAQLDRSSAREYITLVHRTCDCLRRLPAPVIARIDGYALGAGLEVAVCCDFRIASTRSKFGMPEVRVGIPSVVEAALIPGLIGFGRVRELVMLGEVIDADTALRWGLVGRVVSAAELDRAVDQVLASILAAGPQALRIQKGLTQAWERLPTDEAVAAGIDAFAQSFDTDEPQSFLGAFLKRKR